MQCIGFVRPHHHFQQYYSHILHHASHIQKASNAYTQQIYFTHDKHLIVSGSLCVWVYTKICLSLFLVCMCVCALFVYVLKCIQKIIWNIFERTCWRYTILRFRLFARADDDKNNNNNSNNDTNENCSSARSTPDRININQNLTVKMRHWIIYKLNGKSFSTVSIPIDTHSIYSHTFIKMSKSVHQSVVVKHAFLACC